MKNTIILSFIGLTVISIIYVAWKNPFPWFKKSVVKVEQTQDINIDSKSVVNETKETNTISKNKVVSETDISSPEKIGQCGSVEKSSTSYFKDKNTIFVGNEAIKSIDVQSFEYLGSYTVLEGLPYSVSYAKDKNVVYYSCGKILNNADTLTFTDLKNGYAKDKNSVWYLAEIISGADTITFHLLGSEGYAKDKNNVYFGSVIEKADTETFTTVQGGDGQGGVYAKDKNNVYIRGEILRGLDPKTFTKDSLKDFDYCKYIVCG